MIYFIVPDRFRNAVLLVSSLLFYFWGEPVYCIVMVASALVGYLSGYVIGKLKGTGYAKPALIVSVVLCLLPLLFFKYSNFFIENINSLTGSSISLLAFTLPIGISFYTFQILSYTVDVYRSEARVQKNPISFMAYVTLFPQLIAGPIVRYQTIQDELDNRKHSLADFSSGITKFVIGLGKKVLIANSLAELGSILGGLKTTSVLSLWGISIAYTLQIYFDFSGYSDMAIGLGRMFGFHFLENFNYPFVSQSISEFWRRWHISLGSWFRDYVYIPLGGNRCSKGRWFFNVLVVWFLTGFWHGASWNFITWGLYFAFFLIIEKLFLGKLLEKTPAFFRTLYVMIFINFSFVLFNANSLSEALDNLSGMFGFLNLPLADVSSVYYLSSFAFVLIFAAVLSTPYPAKLVSLIKKRAFGRITAVVLEPVACVVVILIVTGSLVDGSFNPFLYFRF